MTRYNVNYSETFPFSDQTFSILLAINTALEITVPGTETQLYRAKFTRSNTAEIWMRKNGTATAPSANSSDTTSNQELVPLDEARYVQGGDTLSFISGSASSVSVSLLLVQDNS